MDRNLYLFVVDQKSRTVAKFEITVQQRSESAIHQLPELPVQIFRADPSHHVGQETFSLLVVEAKTQDEAGLLASGRAPDIDESSVH